MGVVRIGEEEGEIGGGGGVSKEMIRLVDSFNVGFE